MRKFSLLILFVLSLVTAKSQTPPWFFINTGVENTHIVLILPTADITLDGNPLAVGDYIGAFYSFGDTLLCGTGTGATGDVGGMMMISTVNAATIWGAEPNVNNGFQVNEEFKWKVWRASDGSVFDAVATYDLTAPGIPDSGYFLINGISKLASLSAESPPGTDLSINQQPSPLSSCFLTSEEYIDITLENHDSIPVFDFTVNYTLNNGDTISVFITDTIQGYSTYFYSFPDPVDLSLPGDYNFHSWVTISGDVNYTNDDNGAIVTHFAHPDVFIGNDTTICEGDSLILIPDDFYDSYYWNTDVYSYHTYAGEPGWYILQTEDSLGCPGTDSLYLSNYSAPNPNIPDSVSFCEGTYTNVRIRERFQHIIWSNGLLKPNLYITNPGTYWVTVTDFAGCVSIDSLYVSEIPEPTVELGNDIYTLEYDTIWLDAGDLFDTYFWSTGATTQAIQGSHYGSYTVTVTFGECEGEDQVKILPLDTVIIEEIYQLYQNLTESNIIIAIFQANEGKVELYNALGQIINSYDLKNPKNYISLHNLRKGVYFIRIEIEGKTYLERIVKA